MQREQWGTDSLLSNLVWFHNGSALSVQEIATMEVISECAVVYQSLTRVH